MKENILYKFVFQDGNDSKVVIGYLEDDTEFLYKVKRQSDNKIVDIGKRTLIHKCPVEDNYGRR